MLDPRQAARKRRLARRLALVLGLIIVVTPVAASANQGRGRCAFPDPDTAPVNTLSGEGESSSSDSTGRIRMAFEDRELIEIGFGHERGPLKRELRLLFVDVDAVPNAPKADERILVSAPNLTSSSGEQIPSEQLLAVATVDKGRTAVDVWLCVDPSSPSKASAGAYTGILRVGDSRFVEQEVPVTVTLQDSRWGLAIAGALVGGVVGAAYSVVSHLAGVEIAKRRALRVFAIALVLGLGLGLVVFNNMYLEDVDFAGDWVAILLASFAAAAAASGIAAILERVGSNYWWGDGEDKKDKKKKKVSDDVSKETVGGGNGGEDQG